MVVKSRVVPEGSKTEGSDTEGDKTKGDKTDGSKTISFITERGSYHVGEYVCHICMGYSA